MANFPAHMDATEARIVNKVLTALLNAGYHIAVHDGEELALSPSRKRAEIQAEVAATDMTTLIAYTPSETKPGKWKRQGNIMLVHGNGEDVVSDMGAPDNEMLDKLEALIDPVIESSQA